VADLDVDPAAPPLSEPVRESDGDAGAEQEDDDRQEVVLEVRVVDARTLPSPPGSTRARPGSPGGPACNNLTHCQFRGDAATVLVVHHGHPFSTMLTGPPPHAPAPRRERTCSTT